MVLGQDRTSGHLAVVHSGMGRKRSDDKKTCRWVLDNGTICGRSFSKFDSLRRHVQELHKGILTMLRLRLDERNVDYASVFK